MPKPPAVALAALWLLSGHDAGANPIGTDALTPGGWTRGGSRPFALEWDGAAATLWIDGLVAGTYGSLDTCCADVLLPVLETGPGATVTLGDLQLNSLPIDTEVVLTWSPDPLEALRTAGFDNLARLDGTMTLDWVVLSEPGAVFDATENALPAIPEPTTLILMGLGAAGVVAGRRLARRGRRLG